MTDKDQQLEQFREAVDRKQEESSRAGAARSGPSPEELAGGGQRSLDEPGRPQETRSVRAKSAGKRKKTADKWNQ